MRGTNYLGMGFAVIVFVGFIIPMLSFAQDSLMNYEVRSEVAEEDAETLNAVNSIEACFYSESLSLTGIEDAISTEFLDLNRNKEPEDICRHVPEGFNAYIEEISSGRSWDFDNRVVDADQHVVVAIYFPMTGDTLPGVLYVKKE